MSSASAMFVGYTCAALGAVQDDLGVDERLVSAGHLVPAHTVGAEGREQSTWLHGTNGHGWLSHP